MSAATGNAYVFGRHEPASHVLIHVSDPHFLAEGARLGGRYDVEDTFARTLVAIRAVHPSPAAIVLTSDLTDLGEPDAYRRLRDAVEPVAQDLGTQVIWVAGNHDERPAMRRDLLGQAPSLDPISRAFDLDGLRLIPLDSSVPGWHPREIGADQLSWLATEPTSPAPLATVPALPPPPLPSPAPLFHSLHL